MEDNMQRFRTPPNFKWAYVQGDVPTLPTQEEIDTTITNLNSYLQNESIPLIVRNFVYAYAYMILTGDDILNCSNCLNNVVNRANADQKSAILQSLVAPN